MTRKRAGSIVRLKNNYYDFEVMEEQLYTLAARYNFLKLEIIGESVLELPLYKVSIGKGTRKIHINASHHGNEWITSFVLMQSIERFCKEGLKNPVYRKALEEATYDFVPMVNPDGVLICIHGIQYILQNEKREQLIKWNEGSLDFLRWKSNFRGVDLNRNYPAGFETYEKISLVKAPSYEGYQGEMPASEPESKALIRLTQKENYAMVLAYHTQGEVIYWNYGNRPVAGSMKYAKMFEEVSGYHLDDPDALATGCGYKDWFIAHFNRPGFTIECGYGENPIEPSQWSEILERTFPILLIAAKSL